MILTDHQALQYSEDELTIIAAMPDPQVAIDDYRRGERDVAPARSHWASRIGHPCDRFLVYCWTHWQDQIPHDPVKLSIFRLGRLFEEGFKADMLACGLKYNRQELRAEDKAAKIGGRVDGFFYREDNGEQIVHEGKSCSPFLWGRINVLEDFWKESRWYYRGYPDQILLYCYLTDTPVGLFTLQNKVTGRIKAIPVFLDRYWDYVDAIFKKAERLNHAIGQFADAGTDEAKDHALPARIPFGEVCRECEFRHTCLPDQDFSQGVEILEDAEIEKILVRRWDLIDGSGEYSRCDRRVKEWAKAQDADEIHIGKFIIHKRTIPVSRKAQPAKETTQTRIEISLEG